MIHRPHFIAKEMSIWTRRVGRQKPNDPIGEDFSG